MASICFRSIMSQESQKYTLSLPVEIYNELKNTANNYDTSMKNLVRQCLKFGLIGIEINEDPDSEIIFRENVGEDGRVEFRDTRVRFLI